MKVKIFVFLFVIAMMELTGCSSRKVNKPADIDLSSCLRELSTVATFEKTPRGKVSMISTYDRTGGNRDWGNLRNTDKDGLVTIANLKGPGCVKRIWMTSVPATEWCFFFDGEKTPRIRTKDINLFGKTAPFLPPLCDKVSGGAYCYMPLPYAESLRIAVKIPELKKDARPYYHINYETYSAGTIVSSFPKKLSSRENELIKKVREVWAENKESYQQTISSCVSNKNFTVPPGKSVDVFNYSESGKLKALVFSLQNNKFHAYKRDRLLRQLRLQIFWDGNDFSSVDVPFGDFFCNGINNRHFASMPLAHIGNNFICRFPMPFKKGAKIVIKNDGDNDCSISFAYNLLAGKNNAADINYFHSRWVQAVSTGVPLRVLNTDGQGSFVGCYLVNRGMDGTWNILEGDETMFVDGETSPSLHGTGLEDYFNGAWYYYGLFDLPLHGLLEKAAMSTAQYRFHLADAIPFTKSFSLNFEFGDGNRARGYMSAVAYWYQRKAVSAGTIMPEVSKRYPPLNKFELAAVMSNIFELERAGLYEDAMNRCLYYAARIDKSAWSDMLTLRAVRYEEKLYGFDKVKERYKTIIKSTTIQDVKKQAEQLLWFHDAETNALLGASMPAFYKIYLDGKLVGESGDRNGGAVLTVWPVTVTSGKHEIEMEVTPIRSDSWITCALRMHGKRIISGDSWECSKSMPANWPNTAGVEWKKVVRGDMMLPKMSAWQFWPNAFIDMQSGKQLMRPWKGWDKPPGMPAYLRKEFIVP